MLEATPCLQMSGLEFVHENGSLMRNRYSPPILVGSLCLLDVVFSLPIVLAVCLPSRHFLLSKVEYAMRLLPHEIETIVLVQFNELGNIRYVISNNRLTIC